MRSRRVLAVAAVAAVVPLAAAIPAVASTGTVASPSTAAGVRPGLATHNLVITRDGVTAHVTIRGNWRLASPALPATHLPRIVTTPHAQAASDPVEESNNWSGYVDVAHSGVALRYVTANFNAPNVDCALSTEGSSGYAIYAAWTGLDGFSGKTVEQDGTINYCENNGDSGYYTWYEMYPGAQVDFSGVNPGDALRSSVYYDSTKGYYELDLVDLTQGGAGISADVRCPAGSTCKNASAEVISEATGGGPVDGVNLPDFGQTNYTTAGVTSRDGLKGTLVPNSLWSSYELKMTGSGAGVIAAPGPLQGNTAFLVNWLASS